jgi:hypothetical protein
MPLIPEKPVIRRRKTKESTPKPEAKAEASTAEEPVKKAKAKKVKQVKAVKLPATQRAGVGMLSRTYGVMRKVKF